MDVSLDVTDPVAIASAVDQVMSRFGNIDVLVHNAGYGYFALIEEGEDAAMRAIFETNVFGPRHHHESGFTRHVYQ